MSAVARRYATAAVEVAASKGGNEAVDSLANGLALFHSAYLLSPELQNVLKNPLLQNEGLLALQAVLQKLGLNDDTKRFILLLANRSRLKELGEIVQATLAAADKHCNRLRAYITSAIALTPEQKQRLKQILEQRCSQPVILSITVNTEIIGGLICHMGDVTLDASLRQSLDLLRERFLA
ncbi:MAG: ATP synthase F1 subunit delta [Deltaproteobacteria bacterium]|nr:ATP synthase F1 subunit delta [Deltaproteobacteria bacterium]